MSVVEMRLGDKKICRSLVFGSGVSTIISGCCLAHAVKAACVYRGRKNQIKGVLQLYLMQESLSWGTLKHSQTCGAPLKNGGVKLKSWGKLQSN